MAELEREGVTLTCFLPHLHPQLNLYHHPEYYFLFLMILHSFPQKMSAKKIMQFVKLYKQQTYNNCYNGVSETVVKELYTTARLHIKHRVSMGVWKMYMKVYTSSIKQTEHTTEQIHTSPPFGFFLCPVASIFLVSAA